MTLIEDNYYEQNDFNQLQKYCTEGEFNIYTAAEGKQFLVLPVPEAIMESLECPFGEEYRNVLTFIRKAHSEFDTDPRIHCDGIIHNTYVEFASVLYINDSKGVTPNGTMFYEHAVHGESLPKDVSPELYNETLEDSNKSELWTAKDVIYAKPNRMLTYPANHFHGKFPAKIEEGERIVMVVFWAR